ncbi:methyltransferase, partial [Undibacterium sp.]|uniref:class I SAM-dependent DNA methyltransferase n=1 Tax=Undibacterium sp. TaxID=1914977 RepID=UPI00374D14CD
AWCNRGMALQKLQYVEDAIDSYDRALGIRPEFAHAHLGRANSLRSLQRNDEAIAAYMQAMECGADAEQVNYALAALGAVAAPAASPGAYVRELFDQYAGHFEDHLQQNLQYRTPALLVELLTPHLPPGPLDIVDLGCGTGLCGVLLKPYAGTLDGIDLSTAMLEQAKQKNIYDSLACTEISEFLGRLPQRYDVALAADVFVYIGDLSGIFSAASKALKAGGLFAFSVEEAAESEQQDVVLRASRRFAHSLAYLHRMAGEHGFAIDEMARRVVRQDDGVDLHGYLAVMHRL